MFGTIVRVYFSNRDDYLEVKVKDVSPDALNLAWNEAVASENGVFNVTNQMGARITIHTNKVDAFAALPWNL